MLLASVPAQAATPEELYSTWQKNSLQQPAIAEKAAADYLQAAPTGPHAHSLQIWLDAYHKALSGFLAKAPSYARQAPTTKQASAQAPATAPPPQKREASAAAPKQASAPPSPPVAAPHPPVPQRQASAQPPAQITAPHPPPPERQQASVQPAVPPPAIAAPEKRQASLPVPAQHPPVPVQPRETRPAIPPDNPTAKVAPQNNLADAKPEGRSLPEALAFIADKVSGENRIDFVAEFRDPAGSREIVQHLSYQASNVNIDPNRCQLSYRWHVEQDYRGMPDQNRTVELRLAKTITVEPIDVALADLNREAGHPFSVRARPQLYAVHVARWDSRTGDNLYFRDSRTATRVGEAARSAMELCDDKDRQAFRGR